MGEVIEKYSYDAFGQPTTTYSAGVFNNRFKFTGREYAATFGIYEYRNRAYHPGLGRFLSEDLIGFSAGDANLFRYCGGDPVNGIDPFGLKAEPKKKEDINPGINPFVTWTSNYTPTGSHIPQTRTATWNGSSWDISYRDAVNSTVSMGSFVLVGGLGGGSSGGSGDRGGVQFVSTSTPLGRAPRARH